MVQRKKILIVLFAILVLSTSPALAQSGFRRLPPGKLAIGMGYQRYQPPTRTKKIGDVWQNGKAVTDLLYEKSIVKGMRYRERFQ